MRNICPEVWSVSASLTISHHIFAQAFGNSSQPNNLNIQKLFWSFKQIPLGSCTVNPVHQLTDLHHHVPQIHQVVLVASSDWTVFPGESHFTWWRSEFNWWTAVLWFSSQNIFHFFSTWNLVRCHHVTMISHLYLWWHLRKLFAVIWKLVSDPWFCPTYKTSGRPTESGKKLW